MVTLWTALLLIVAAAALALRVSPAARRAAFRGAYYLYAETRAGLALTWLQTRSPESVSAAMSLEGHSSVLFTSFRGFGVVPVPVLGDNYAYLLVDERTREAALVDPADPAVCLRAVELAGVRLTHVLTTHKHWDHSGGNEKIAAAFPGVEVVGGRLDNVPGATRHVDEGDTVMVGGTPVKVVHTPGHTRGHVLYVAHPQKGAPAGAIDAGRLATLNAAPWQGAGGRDIHSAAPPVDPLDEGAPSCAVFTGDEIFSAGCGRFFEGDAAQFVDAFGRLGRLPDGTLLFCGHEYTAANLEFAAWAEPDSRAVAAKARWVADTRATGTGTVPFSLAEERLVNPFMRAAALADTIERRSGRKLAAGDRETASMALLRELKSSGAHKQNL